MVHVNFKKPKRHRQKSTHPPPPSSSSTSVEESYNNETKEQSLNSISLSSISNMKHSSNNSAFVYLQSKKSHDNLECKIS